MHGREDSSHRQTPRVETLVDRLPTTMMPPMQKMAAPLALASALCHIATIAVIGNMHIQPSTLRDTAAGAPRSLLESPDGDALVSVRAQLEGMRDELETMRADKRGSDERVELLSSRVDRLAEELRATRGSTVNGPPCGIPLSGNSVAPPCCAVRRYLLQEKNENRDRHSK